MTSKVNFNQSIGTRLLRYVFGIYFIVTLVVTLVQMYLEFERTKDQLFDEVMQVQVTFEKGLTETLWNFADTQAKSNIEGLLQTSLVRGIKVVDKSGGDFVSGGYIPPKEKIVKTPLTKHKGFSSITVHSESLGEIYEYEFDLIYNDNVDGKVVEKNIGKCFIYTSQSIVIKRVTYGFILILINSIIKTLALWMIFLFMARAIVTRPLDRFTRSLESIKPENPAEDKDILDLSKRKDEIGFLAQSFGSMIKAVQSNLMIINNLNSSLEIKVNQRTEELSKTNAEITKLFESLRQGILIIDSNFNIGDRYSSFLENILETNQLAQQNVFDVLFDKSTLDSDVKSQMKQVISLCIGETELNFHNNRHILPIETQWTSENGEVKYLGLDWEPITNEKTGYIDNIILVIRDVTMLHELQQEADARKKELDILISIVHASVSKFMSFSQDALVKIQQMISSLEMKPKNFDKILKILHTLKGNARIFDFRFITESIHLAESTISSIDKEYTKALESQPNNLDVYFQKVHKTIDGILKNLKEYEEVYNKNLGENPDVIQLKKTKKYLSKIRELASKFNHIKLSSEKDTSVVKEIADDIEKNLDLVESVSLTSLIEDCDKPLKSLAIELGKTAPKIIVNSDIEEKDLLISSKENISRIKDVFVHLIRNSMDHGIETDTERAKKHKPIPGRISFDVKKSDKCITLYFLDDGRGLQLQSIKDKARRLKIHPQSDDDIGWANLIFNHAFSTKEEVTLISGCGIGMGAVRHYVEEMGGSITLHLIERGSNFEKPFFFKIEMPTSIFMASALTHENE